MPARQPDDVTLADGKIVSKERCKPRDVDRRCDASWQCRSHRAGEGQRGSAEDKAHARNTHSAIFAEVKVDEELGVIRVTRVVNAVAAGRILNLKTAHSQIMGGVVWGIGMALHEETLVDHLSAAS